MGPIITLFGAEVTGFGLWAALALAAALAGAGFWCWAQRTGLRPWLTAAVLSVPLVLIMSRLVYVLANITYYITTLEKPLLMLNFWDGGYSLTGAFLGLVLAAALAGKLTGVKRRVLLDAVGLGAPLGVLAERLGEAGTGMGLGREILSEGLRRLAFFAVEDPDLDGALVHAVYRYEVFFAGLLFIALLAWAMTAGRRAAGGDLLLVFMTVYGAGQTVLESLRNDGHMQVHFVRIQQVLAILMLVIALAVWSRRLVRMPGHPRAWPGAAWLITLAGIGAATWMEFRVDHSEHPALDYAMMLLCTAAAAAAALTVRRMTMKKEA